jgi:ribosomal protein S18 acetylase RimI-like enzyme
LAVSDPVNQRGSESLWKFFQMSFLYTIRQATKQDQRIVSDLIGLEYYVHRHLDWRTAFDWLTYQPYLLMLREQRLVAALACPADPPGVAWIRLFASTSSLPPSETWGPLFENAHTMLQQDNQAKIVALALQDWFGKLIEQSGFQHHQNIVVLKWSGKPPEPRTTPVSLIIRPMLQSDLPEVEVVDRLAFEPLWQHTLSSLTLAFQQSAYATVAELNGLTIGYQICTATPFSAHLARLAVRPDLQRNRLGQTIVTDLLWHFKQRNINHITVNTQDNNGASLALYKKIGFLHTGETFPVLIYPEG